MFPVKKTLHSLKQAKLYKVMVASALISLIGVILFIITATTVSSGLIDVEKNWLDSLINVMAGLLFGIAGWFMLPSFVILIAGLFQDRTIKAVNTIDYPNEKQYEESHFFQDLMHDIRFTLFALLLNCIILPFYLIGLGFIMSVMLNSYLLGREFFEGAAAFYIGKKRAVEVRRDNKKSVYAGGLVITLITLIPVVNLFVPVLAIVWMVHTYQASNSASS